MSRARVASCARTCFTYGQWLQMNITSNASSPAKSSRWTISPEVTSGNAKPGACVPSGSIVEVAAIASYRTRVPGDRPPVETICHRCIAA